VQTMLTVVTQIPDYRQERAFGERIVLGLG
jgi:hypothetical protein